MVMSVKLKKVISVSRRCDLIAHYPDYVINELQKYPPGEAHTVVIWTKNPENLTKHISLYQALREYSNLYLLLTITGMGGTIVEPGVPYPEEVFKQIPDIIDFAGGPEHIGIRYDPLIEIIDTSNNNRYSNMSEDKFEPVLEMISLNKIPRLIVSVAQKYGKSEKRMKKMGLIFLENYQVKAEE
ncbi:MAG: DUF1848 family protein, partial [candidate division Zixibacteria bacterium]|nr:DUF1848 family protein [candidate division Zixibacteria bacterium]